MYFINSEDNVEWASGVAEPRAGSEERERGSLTRWLELSSSIVVLGGESKL